MTAVEFTNGMMVLSSIYRNFEPNEQAQEIWYRLFEGDSAKEFHDAITEYALVGKFPPVPADLKEIIAKKRTAYLPSPELEWERVCHAASAIGRYQWKEAMEAVGDANWLAIRKIGGWDKVCNMTMANYHFMKREFLEHLGETQQATYKEALMAQRFPKLIAHDRQGRVD